MRRITHIVDPRAPLSGPRDDPGRPAATVEPLENRALLSAGETDVAFGSAGFAAADFASLDDRAGAAAVTADGKVLVVGRSQGRLAMARFNADGTPDAGFGTSGKVLKAFGAPGRFDEVAIGPGGRIVILGQVGGRYVLIRYNADGSLDRAFGRNGRIETGLAARKRHAAAILAQPRGRVLCALSVNRATVLCRYNSDGTLDGSFGAGGQTIIADAAVDDMAVQTDGRIIVGGQMTGDFYLARFTSRGRPDRTFGGDGHVTTRFQPPRFISEIHKLAVLSDGRILAAGSAQALAVARYLPDGRLDHIFGTDAGFTRTLAEGNPEVFRGLAIQANGRIVAAGVTRRTLAPPDGPAVNDAIIVRYSRNGLLDGRFSNGGRRYTKLGHTVGADDDVVGCFIAPDGDILVAGTHNGDFAVGCFKAE